MTQPTDALRRLPRMDDLLDDPELRRWSETDGVSRQFLRSVASEVLATARRSITAGELAGESLDEFLTRPAAAVLRAAGRALEPYLRRVVNATGVVVHTNLGRSPWSPAAAARVADLATGYTNLEFDLDQGERGGRDEAVRRWIGHLLPDCDVAVVNNNAAAVLLMLNTFAQGREVLVSRGQLVEIGGSFRIPEVMEKGFCRLREVGTTNRTRVADFEAAIGPESGLLLAVHPSNYRVVGFTEEVPLEELVALGDQHGVPVAEDLGSGSLVPTDRHGVAEPTVAERLASGVDLVTFSGDKLLGGPQAGFIVGRPEAVARCRANPLYRALRIDKGTLLALEATLTDYVAGRLDVLPTQRMIRLTSDALRGRAQELRDALAAAMPLGRFDLVELESRVGGGAAPEVGLDSWGVTCQVGPGADEIARRLRAGSPAVVGRIIDDRFTLDTRTLLDGDHDRVVAAFLQLGEAPR